MKLICFGVRPIEKLFFEQLNKKYQYKLTLVEQLMTKANINLIENHEAVMIRANCLADQESLLKMKNMGVKYLVTRTIGINHIDVKAAQNLGIKLAYVPNYSPNAIAELAVTMGLMLLRKLPHMINKMQNNNFIVDNYMFSKEVRNSTIGIIGTGKIGLTAAKTWKVMGANILGYDIVQSKEAKTIVNFCALETLLKSSDLVSFHLPYIKNKTDNMINADLLLKMKKNAILINTSRGEVMDHEAVLDALKTGHLQALATDVIRNENQVFFRKFNNRNEISDSTIKKLIQMYPRVIITPHIGSYTDEALTNMIQISYENIYEYINTGDCKNKIIIT